MDLDQPVSTSKVHTDEAGVQRQQMMIAACAAGNLPLLQTLLSAAGAKKGDAPVEPKWIAYPDSIAPVPESGPAATSTLLSQAVIHARPNILAFLLSMYPTAPAHHVLYDALAHPDETIFKLLYRHDPAIVNHEFESQHKTALMVACSEGAGNPLLPNLLLDNGADPNEGMGIWGPLVCAIDHGQPLSLIQKMIASGAWVRSAAVNAAVRARRLDALQFFLNHCTIYDQDILQESLRKDVEELGDKEIIRSVDGWLAKLAK
ncbi:MAG: hypothetical protein Q9207_005285 [Kuettlingeria erythrocarpa]